MTIRLGVAGAAGRMGRQIIAAINNDPTTTLTAATMPPEHPQIGANANILAGLPAGDVNISHAIAPDSIDALIDFTTPAAAMESNAFCRRHRVAAVIGVTGFSDEQKNTLRESAKDIPLVFAPNMSVGINIMFILASQAAQLLKAGALGGGYDIEISEAHHRHKKDAPSGTALRLGEVISQATKTPLKENAVFVRAGNDNARNANDIGFSVVRGGDIVGEHRAMFIGNGEQLEIVHRSTSRANYATGAVRAAIFVAAAAPGLYNMDDVLNA